MQSLADGLPPDVARQLPTEWWNNEKGYWEHRDVLATKYLGQWIAFAAGKVIASGASPVEVFHAAQRSGQHPYVVCVGREQEPFRIRRAAFSYDSSYAGEPLPVVKIEFRTQPNTPGILFDRVIPDTGADASALPWSDCQRLALDPSSGIPARIGGVAQSSSATLIFSIWAFLDGRDYACQLQADFAGDERILGREVLNRIDVLFRGPAGEVLINP